MSASVAISASVAVVIVSAAVVALELTTTSFISTRVGPAFFTGAADLLLITMYAMAAAQTREAATGMATYATTDASSAVSSSSSATLEMTMQPVGILQLP
jgi:hypothetical protein